MNRTDTFSGTYSRPIFKKHSLGRRKLAIRLLYRRWMLHRVSKSAVCKLYPCYLVHMFYVMSTHMFYKPVFPHISHSVAVRSLVLHHPGVGNSLLFHEQLPYPPSAWSFLNGEQLPFSLKACSSV